MNRGSALCEEGGPVWDRPLTIYFADDILTVLVLAAAYPGKDHIPRILFDSVRILSVFIRSVEKIHSLIAFRLA